MCQESIELRGLFANMDHYVCRLYGFLDNLHTNFTWRAKDDVIFVDHKPFYMG